MIKGPADRDDFFPFALTGEADKEGSTMPESKQEIIASTRIRLTFWGGRVSLGAGRGVVMISTGEEAADDMGIQIRPNEVEIVIASLREMLQRARASEYPSDDGGWVA